MRRHPDHPNGPAERLDRAQANRLLKSGLGGALFAALCCFTPLLVVVLAGAGLSAVTGWLDYVLLSVLIIVLEFRGALILTLFAAALTGAYALFLNSKSSEVRL